MAPRPSKKRWVEFVPDVTYFKPAGVRMRDLEEIQLTVEELEALRLKDVDGLDQNRCAECMNLSQSTFQRLLAEARSKIARAVVGGSAIRIEGGNYNLLHRRWRCLNCQRDWEGQPVPADDPPQCPSCESTETAPLKHRGRGHRPPDRPGRSRGAGRGRGGR